MIRIHHLNDSQSERIVWLCEELGIPYELQCYQRDPVTRLSPPALKALHPLGAAPVIEDGDVMLAESAAIVEYIIVKHGQGRLKPGPESAAYADFLYWFHFANGTLQPALLRLLSVSRAQLPDDHPVLTAVRGRAELALSLVEARLAVASCLAGDDFSAADIMTLFSLTTMLLFQPVDLAPYPAIRAYVQRMRERPAYLRSQSRT
ncbi:glutathione S-transferase [Duganella sp. FT80W]|uniref:glutathione transferase n=1 Tax=Duganella guangzhouensis TaxID=2666084 RepID=A0A6I2KXP5_9BURK|nr:glutathione S-transferase family protein [Duganella guangzhouensis]MRW90895.1 glutathione S-transferase [Duganella guangzhouensis]